MFGVSQYVNGQIIDEPEKVGCADGLVIIIGTEETHKFFVYADNNESISLAEIAEKYPDVYMVIIEDFLSGVVFRYGNIPSDPKTWQMVGKTIGFA